MNKMQAALMLILAMTVSTLAAQEAGEFITFVVPEGTEITIFGTGDPGDKIIFVGRASETMEGGNCAVQVHIQSAVIVDPRSPGIRTTRRTEVFAVSQGEPVRPGTRVRELVQNSQCQIGEIVYDKYTGVVD